MNRRGFALLTVLWLTVLLAACAAAGTAIARTDAALARNRTALARARWARDACVAMLLAAYARDTVAPAIDSVEIKPGTWCRLAVENPAARLNVNLVAPDVLRRLLGRDSLTDALLDWRDADAVPRLAGAEADWHRSAGRRPPRDGPLADLAELAQVRGFDAVLVARLSSTLTTRGAGQVDPNLAPAEVLAVLPGLQPATVDAIVRRRLTGRMLRNLDELVAIAPASERDSLYANYQELLRMTVFAPTVLIAIAEGWDAAVPVVARETLTLAPMGTRLAIVRREVE